MRTNQETQQAIDKEVGKDLILSIAEVVAECDNYGYRGFLEQCHLEAAKKIIALVKKYDQSLDAGAKVP